MHAVLRLLASALLALTPALALPTLLLGPARADVRPVPETSWGVDGPVLATAVAGNVVVVGGNFSAAVSPAGERVPRANLAAFSLATGAVLNGWRADTNGAVRALTTDGRSLWVGGGFTRIGDVARPRLAKVWAHWGVVDRAFRARVGGGPVLALEPAGAGLLVGGTFTKVGGTERRRLARVRGANGRLAARFRPDVDGAVRGVALAGGTVYLAGDFSRIGGTPRRGVGAVARATGALRGPAFASSVSPSFGVDVSTDGSRVLVAAGEYANALVAWSATSGERLFRHTAMGDVQALDIQGDRVYFGFHEGFGGDTNLKVLAARVSTGELVADFRPSIDSFWGVRAITATPDVVIVGGEFSRVGGVTARGWARFRG